MTRMRLRALGTATMSTRTDLPTICVLTRLTRIVAMRLISASPLRIPKSLPRRSSTSALCCARRTRAARRLSSLESLWSSQSRRTQPIVSSMPHWWTDFRYYTSIIFAYGTLLTNFPSMSPKRPLTRILSSKRFPRRKSPRLRRIPLTPLTLLTPLTPLLAVRFSLTILCP